MKLIVLTALLATALAAPAPMPQSEPFPAPCGRSNPSGICTTQAYCAKVGGFYVSRDCTFYSVADIGCCYNIPKQPEPKPSSSSKPSYPAPSSKPSYPAPSSTKPSTPEYPKPTSTKPAAASSTKPASTKPAYPTPTPEKPSYPAPGYPHY